MRFVTLFALATALATPALAAPPTTSPKLNMALGNVGRQPPFSAMWLDAIPRIAELCELKVSKAQMFNVASTFRGGNEIDNDLQMIRSHPDMNIIYAELSGLDVNGKANQSCDTAVRLWGEDGDMFPGVLLGH
jgi:hypothetical protein